LQKGQSQTRKGEEAQSGGRPRPMVY